MKLTPILCSVLTSLILVQLAPAYDCDAWPDAAEIEDHSAHSWTCIEDWAGPPDSDVIIDEDSLVWTKDEWNQTEDLVNWNLTDSASTTHSWGVSASVRADLKAGLLTKVVADAKIGVEVGGEYSGSKLKTRQVQISTTIQACRGKGRREYVDGYNATVTQEYSDHRWYCAPCASHPTYDYTVWTNKVVDSDTAGHGDLGLTGVFTDLGPWSQSSNPCLHCYQAP